MTLRYGNRCIDLARGRRAVQVESLAEVIETLQTLREAAREGAFADGRQKHFVERKGETGDGDDRATYPQALGR